MPVSIDDYALPSWIKYKERYPLVEDKKHRYMNTVNPRVPYARHAGDPVLGWAQAGYNPNHNSTRIERINLTSEDITLKPY